MREPEPPADPAMKPTARQRAGDPIAEGLRRLWASAETEPVPDEFMDMLDRIDAARPKPAAED